MKPKEEVISMEEWRRRESQLQAELAGAISWLRPYVDDDGFARYPACEGREETEKDEGCALTAKVDYRGKMLCKRHASTLALRELITQSRAEQG